MPSRLVMCGRALELDSTRPLLMGIVNASPESFSDGNRIGGVEEQVALARRLVGDGAAIIDVGGESGVTDREPVEADEEIRRVVPLIERLAAEGIAVSVDTWKAAVARAAIAAGAVMVNDTSALRDPGIAEACAATGAALVVMHTRADPKQKIFPVYDDVVADVVDLLGERLEQARGLGVAQEQLVVDPGPDFAKTPADSVELIRHLSEIGQLHRPVLLAVSRKDFVGAITGRPPQARLAGTLAALGAGLDGGASIVRVHDVAAAADYIAVRAAVRGERKVDPALRLADALRRAG